jgi:hypothetical protein
MRAKIDLAPLPPNWTNDSPAGRNGVNDQIVVPSSLKGQGWWVSASDRCSFCHGRGMVKRIEHDVTVSTGEDGKEHEERVSYEDEGPCDCVFALCNREEARRSLRGVPSGPEPAPREDPKPNTEYTQKRAARLREEIMIAEGALEEEKREHAAKVAPFLARVTELEKDAEQAIQDEAEAQRIAMGCEVQVNEARLLLDQARANLEAAEKLAAEAQENLREHVEEMAPMSMALAKAKDDVRVAQNRGGHRHRVQVKEQRLADLRKRLEAVERDLPKVVEEAPVEAPAAAEATP